MAKLRPEKADEEGYLRRGSSVESETLLSITAGYTTVQPRRPLGKLTAFLEPF
jgi:hypothetical protein